MVTIERRQRGRRSPVRRRVRWRDPDGRERSRTFEREEDARRFRARLDGDLAAGTWVDPTRARATLGEWTGRWRESILDLRPSTLARLDATLRTHVLPEWDGVAPCGVVNADVRAWAARLHAEGLSASSVRKAVFALRRILSAAVADRRLSHNPADDVPLPTEEAGEQRYLTAEEVATLADVIAPRLRALVLVAADGGLWFGELAASRRERVDALRGRVAVVETLVDVNGQLTFGLTKTRKGRRTVPLPRSIGREVAMRSPSTVTGTADERDEEKVFSLSARGREAREALAVDGADPAADRWRETGGGHGALRALPAEIGGQARQLRRFGSPDQVERAAALLEDVKRELYAILADGPARDQHAEGTVT